MGNNRHQQKDYSRLNRELQKDSEVNLPESLDVNNVSTIGTLPNENNLGIDYDLDSILHSIQKLLQLIALHESCVEDLEKEQDITQDLLHALEFSKNTKNRYKYSTQLCHNRRRRRQYKNTITVLAPIVEFLKKEENKKVFNKLINLLGEARKTKSRVNEKSYSPRVLKEIGVITNGQEKDGK